MNDLDTVNDYIATNKEAKIQAGKTGIVEDLDSSIDKESELLTRKKELVAGLEGLTHDLKILKQEVNEKVF